MASWYDQGVQRCNRVEISEGHSEAVLRDQLTTLSVTEGTASFTSITLGADSSEVGCVPRPLIPVALIAEGLQVGSVVASTVPPGDDVIDVQKAFVSGDTAQLTAVASPLQHLVPVIARDHTERGLPVSVEAFASLLDVGCYRIVTEA